MEANKKISKKYEKTYSQDRNLFEDMIDSEIAEKLEKIRRSK